MRKSIRGYLVIIGYNLFFRTKDNCYLLLSTFTEVDEMIPCKRISSKERFEEWITTNMIQWTKE